MEDARRFAFDELCWLAGVYASLTVARLHSARGGMLWDRPSPEAGSAVRW